MTAPNVCQPVSTAGVQPVDMLYMGTTTVQLGNDAFTFGATQLTGNTLLVVTALAGLALALYLFHRK
ncbi:MAG: hypothetical protein WBR29_03110 [Gammaproteobacteria bacterium]